MKREVAAAAPVWRPPTRRTFVALLGLGVAALAVRSKRRPKAAPVATTRWIGHC